ncbi:YdcF family protein [Actinomyces minihominis]|uniref:YdcF family protein n=1 Tax=Actinomyces minihominis TaxID=2002838 RepID=UPI00101ADE54|nr:ElyC/SanA/YdcF family protein [Actinomyces minihominis]
MEEVPEKSPRRSRRLLGILIGVLTLLVAVMVVMLGITLWWIWNPPLKQADSADAVIVLAYGKDRLAEGRQLAEAGVSDNLVISISDRMESRIEEGRLPVLSPSEVDGVETIPTGATSSGAWVEQCGAEYATQQGSYFTWCFTPDPMTTEGEAIALNQLAQANGWETVVVVTEPSHLNRSLRIFETCTNLEVSGASSDRPGPWYRNLWRSAYEVGATIKVATFGVCGS